MLFLALSSLQGRPMGSAFDELAALGPVGIQLTPGNQPTADFEQQIAGTATRTHHGFSFRRRKDPVWSDDGRCLVGSDSVHPPLGGNDGWWDHPAPVVETMYPGYALGNGDELERAMNAGLFLAVDVSHVFIQRHAGVISEATWRRLQDYPRIAEVHVSKNLGVSDSHLPLTADTFGLEWARAKLKAGTPVVLEAYLHRLSDDSRRAQLDLVLGGIDG